MFILWIEKNENFFHNSVKTIETKNLIILIKKIFIKVFH